MQQSSVALPWLPPQLNGESRIRRTDTDTGPFAPPPPSKRNLWYMEHKRSDSHQSKQQQSSAACPREVQRNPPLALQGDTGSQPCTFLLAPYSRLYTSLSP
ncbi:hypothetical protein CBOM_08098 [Ceraceosorus bombacis]|uniref:Uncharacterized protein n=1 Tax=Ceraceosorus bombacis TaxID=401625 RepID=A0A0P1BKK9_9BASI|nr:hypothetical protein CBOM_08098 [Ceraceosorus bombacis]